jgi:predicted glycosyltransferase
MMANAAGIVAMGGYNTFCEILSFDRPALLIPRKEPRREQLLRAVRATELGLTRMLDIDSGNDPAVMARALRALPLQPRPSVRGAADMLRGLEQIARLASPHLPGRRKRQRDAAALG